MFTIGSVEPGGLALRMFTIGSVEPVGGDWTCRHVFTIRARVLTSWIAAAIATVTT